MRPTKIFAALVALLLAAALPLVSAGNAQAAGNARAVGHHAVAEKARTKVTLNFAANGATSFKLYGKVKPAKKGKTATLLRATKANGSYRKLKSQKTDKKGKFAFTGLKLEGYFKVKIGNATSKVIHVCKGTC